MTREKAKEFIGEHLLTSLGKHVFGYLIYAETANIIIDKMVDDFEKELQRKAQKSYTIGYVQGYLARENQEVPEDIRELLKDKE